MFPKRIISLVPSQTELLYDLGLDEEVIGITKFCVHPEKWFRTKARIGGTKTINIQAVKALQPDLILANKEENVKEQVEALSSLAPVYTSDIKTLEDALEMIMQIGTLVGKDERAQNIVSGIKEQFEQLSLSTNQQAELKVAYLIWREPYMAIGGDTFINDILERCGFINAFKHLNRYPEIFLSPIPSSSTQLPTTTYQPSCQLSSNNCQLLLLSSEPFPFKQKHIDELQLQLPGTKIVLVDGEMFSWYGSRLLHAPAYFKKLITEVYA